MPHTAASRRRPANRASAIAEHCRRRRSLLVDDHDDRRGRSEAASTARREDPTMAEAIAQIDQALKLSAAIDGLARLDGRRAASPLTRDGDGIGGGLVFSTDRGEGGAAAHDRCATFARSAAARRASDPRRGPHGDDDHDHRPRRLPGPRRLAGGGLAPGMELPEGRLEIAYATTDEMVVDRYRRRPSSRPCSTPARAPRSPTMPRYKALIGRGRRGEHAASAFLDIAAVRELIETLGATRPEAHVDVRARDQALPAAARRASSRRPSATATSIARRARHVK